MRIGLNFATPFEDSVNISINENRITAKDLLELMQLDHIDKCRFLKVPGKSNEVQTIEINPSNINSTLGFLGFQDNALYTVIPL